MYLFMSCFSSADVWSIFRVNQKKINTRGHSQEKTLLVIELLNTIQLLRCQLRSFALIKPEYSVLFCFFFLHNVLNSHL